MQLAPLIGLPLGYKSKRLDNDIFMIGATTSFNQQPLFGKWAWDGQGNLFRRPIQHQFTRKDLLQPQLDRKQAPLGPHSRFLGLGIGFIGSILRTASMTCDSRLTVDAIHRKAIARMQDRSDSKLDVATRVTLLER